MQEISKQPLIRAKVREIVREIAVVSTTPTDVGTQVLTPFHKHGEVKRIRDKPAGAIIHEYPHQFLHMVAAEKEGLVKVSIILCMLHPCILDGCGFAVLHPRMSLVAFCLPAVHS